MKLFNTKTRQLEEFKPMNPASIKVYTCGPTVYSFAHIGNFTAYIYWDSLIRLLRLHGWQEKRVLNVTDVGHLASDADEGEDKLEKGARREGKTVWEIAKFYEEDFFKHFNALNLIAPTKIARATDYIEANIALIDRLTQKDLTYELEDGIYFDTSKFSGYADFAHLDLENLKAGARICHNDQKRNTSDFALWKFIQPGEDHAMQWNYLGRPGYPGWHIECSSIIHAELGEPIDIHTGGIDHIPVHHSNEIAQSEAAYGNELANFWLHNNFITVDHQKISKSLGNVYNFDDLAQKGFSHLDYRLWTLQGNYRSERNFSFDDLAAAKQRLKNFRNYSALRHQNCCHMQELSDTEVEKHISSALEITSNNINTPGALAALDQLIASHKQPHQAILEFYDQLLGLNLLESTPDITADQKSLIAERELSKSQKDYAKSDKIREQFKSANINLLDLQDGSTLWEFAD